MSSRQLRLLDPTHSTTVTHRTVLRNTSTICVNNPNFNTHRGTDGDLGSVTRLIPFTRHCNTGVFIALGAVLRSSRLRPTRQLVASLCRANISTLVIRSVKVLRLSVPPVRLRTDARYSVHAIRGTGFLSSINFARVILTQRLGLSRVHTVRRTASTAVRFFVRKTLYITCSNRYCVSRTRAKHDTGHNSYSRTYHLPCALGSSRKQIISCRGRLLSVGSGSRATGLNTLVSTNMHSFGVRKHCGSVDCIGGVATRCHRVLSTVVRRHNSLTHTSSNHARRFFIPSARGAFRHNDASCFIGTHGNSVNTFSSPGFVNLPINRMLGITGSRLSITIARPLTGNSNLGIVVGHRIINFHTGAIRGAKRGRCHI